MCFATFRSFGNIFVGDFCVPKKWPLNGSSCCFQTRNAWWYRFCSTKWWRIDKNVYMGISTVASIKLINLFCGYQHFAFTTCVQSCDHPYTKQLDSFNKCVQHLRYCNGVPLVILQNFASSWSLSIMEYSKSSNRSEFSTSSAVVSAADRPWLTSRMTALTIKAEIITGDTAKSI